MTNWIKETVEPVERKWEEFYRNRFSHDRRVRSTHGANCTGSCSWEIYVKDGIVTWELQATDYPLLEEGIPPYEPRGCQRGVSYSWYLYSPIRVKYPYGRGALLDLWREARKKNSDSVAAWESIVTNPEKRAQYQQARGKGGYRRIKWDEALDIIGAAIISTIKRHGPDRINGFSPIPAMSQISYAAGSRFFTLIGGVPMSFYDWYCDLPPASPEIWGEQTDVHESAAWYHARFIALVGSNINMTRTPDTHFISEARHAGAKLTVFAPDFSQASKYADYWIPVHPGQDTAFWMGVNHVILKEFYVDRQVPYFVDYIKEYTDLPFLVRVDGARPGKYVHANALKAYADQENGDWKMLVWDNNSGRPRMPKGTVGFRWQTEKGKWNIEMKDGATDEDLAPELSFFDKHDSVVSLEFDDFGEGKKITREVPARTIDTVNGKVTVVTVFDLTMAQFGVSRGLKGNYPTSYNDDSCYTPAWQEKFSGIHRDTCIRYAREWAVNAEKTNGRNLVIIGAAANHWYHNNLLYRSAIVALMLTGSVGVTGGGLAHYVGQEKLANHCSWGPIAFAGDWKLPNRQQNSPSFHYVHTDQWRYERGFTAYECLADAKQKEHTIDYQARAVRKGWLPFFPQFNKSSLDVVTDAEAAGAKTEAEIIKHLVDQLKSGKLHFSVDDPDAPECWPRLWFIWRGNAIGTSMKGHEYMMKHYLGTHTNQVGKEMAKDFVTEVKFRDVAPTGKMDLVVDLNFRMDTSALYSDIVLPAATWYEKIDINSTDLHTYVNAMQAAVPPAWESKCDWDIYKYFAKKVSELALVHLPKPVRDLVAIPLQHDTVDEVTQPEDLDWKKGECEPIPGKTMPKFRVVERDYTLIYERMVTLGPGIEENGVAAHGLKIPCADVYQELARTSGRKFNNGKVHPSLEESLEVVNAILLLDPVTNGELAYRAFEEEEHKTGRKLVHLAEGTRSTRYDFADIVSQPRRVFTSPTWSASINKGRPYSPFTLNVEEKIPWRTVSGRQHFYLDHANYLQWGEHLPTYKPRPDHTMLDETQVTQIEVPGARLLNYITPHGKWSIHSTYGDNHRMMTLSRGDYPIWLSEKDAADLGIKDNDWVELFNDNGVFVQRCNVSARIPKGSVFVYHATERTVGVPISPLRNRRAGMNNSCTRARLKPLLMAGGYGQFTFAFNYWGPTGVNRDTNVFVRKVEGEIKW